MCSRQKIFKVLQKIWECFFENKRYLIGFFSFYSAFKKMNLAKNPLCLCFVFHILEFKRTELIGELKRKISCWDGATKCQNDYQIYSSKPKISWKQKVSHNLKKKKKKTFWNWNWEHQSKHFFWCHGIFIVFFMDSLLAKGHS